MATRLAIKDFGKSLSFNGSTAGATSPITVPTTAFSVSFWMNARTWEASDSLVDWADSGPVNGFTFTQITSPTNNVSFVTYDAVGQQSAISSGFMALNRWYHVTATYAVNSVKLYIDGTQVGATDTSATMTNATQTLTLGKRSAAASNYFNGLLDEVCVWNRVLTQDEVTALARNHIVSSSGLLCYYKFDDVATDSSVNAQTATLTATSYSTNVVTPTDRFLIRNFGTALSFDGVDDQVVVTHASSINVGNNDSYSIACWVRSNKMGDFSVSEKWFDDGSPVIDKYPWSLRMGGANSRDGVFNIYDGTNNPGVAFKNLWNGEWHFIVAVRDYDADVIRSYTDGVLSNTTTDSTTGDVSTDRQISIGSRGGTNYFPGQIDKFRLFNRALNATEISALYLRGTVPSGLIGSWLFDEGAGTTATDSSGNGNNGAITGATYTGDVPTKLRKLVGGNLIPNGDLSHIPTVNVATTSGAKWIDGTATGGNVNIFRWANRSGAGSREAIFDTSNLYNGKASLKVSTTGTASWIEVANYNGSGNPTSAHKEMLVPVSPSTSYTYSFVQKNTVISGDSSSGATIAFLEHLGSFGGSIVSNIPQYQKVTSDWTVMTGTFTTNASTRFVVVDPRVYGHQGTATLIMNAWFADISLTRTTPLTRTVA